MLLRRYTCNALPELQITKPPDLHVATLVARFQNSRSPNLLTSMFTRYIVPPEPPCLHIYTPTARLSRYIYTSTSTHQQYVSIAPLLNISILPRPYSYRASPVLHTTILSDLRACNAHPYFHVYTPATHIHTSTSPHLHPVSRPLYLYIAKPTSSDSIP